jgi:ferredoxin--NADP+ reductase
VLADDGKPLAGQYTTGWIKRGPSGVIGTNKACAMETARALLEDAAKLERAVQPDLAAVDRLLAERGVRVAYWHDWLAIDDHEKSLGSASGKDRVKVTNFIELLEGLADRV